MGASTGPGGTTGRAPLGPVLRLLEAYYVLVILFWLAYALPTQGHSFSLDLGAAWILAQVACASVGLWLVEKRARLARGFIVASTAAVMVLAIASAALGAGTVEDLTPDDLLALALVSAPVHIATIAYLSLSRHARVVLCESLLDVEEEQREQDGAMAEVGAGWRTWPFWRDLVIYYCVFSLVGHWAEMGFCQLIRLGVVGGDFDPSNSMLWDQWLYPFPAEGLAAVLVVLLLFPLREWLVRRFGGRQLPALLVSFLANALVCTGIDLITGLTTNADYHLWDYRALPFNFMGQICLQNSLIYSVVATVMVWVVYPWIAEAVRHVPRNVMNGVFVGLVAAYAFLELIYVVNVGPVGLVFG